MDQDNYGSTMVTKEYNYMFKLLDLEETSACVFQVLSSVNDCKKSDYDLYA